MRWLLWTLFSAALHMSSGDELPPGHLKPLGAHREPEQVPRLTYVPSPHEFHTSYVQPGQPVVLEGLLNSTATLLNWGRDSYLRERFGDEEVHVENGKKENRSEHAFLTTMADFLDRYESEDIYLVMDMPDAMQREWMLPHFLLCGGYTSNLMYSYMWFSSGGTKSVLHTDSYENLHCLVSGEKEFVLIEPHYSKTVGEEHEARGYYNIDVDSVDMFAYPGLVSVPWHLAVVRAGDCFYLPYKWIHHVRSYGRNLAVNVWWIQFDFDSDDCSTAGELPDFAPLGKFEIIPELQLKTGLREHIRADGSIHAMDVYQSVRKREGYENLELELVLKMFDILKPGCQGQLMTSDLQSIPLEKFKSAFQYFVSMDPSIAHPDDNQFEEEGEVDQEWKARWWKEEGEEEGEWEGEEEGEWGYGEYDYETPEFLEGRGDYPHDHLPHDEL